MAKSRAVNRIEANGSAYAYVWLDGFGSSPNPAKWDLTDAMRRAASTHGAADYSVAVTMAYRDSDHHWFRSFARLSFIPSQNRLEFGPARSSQRVKCEFLEGFFHWGPFSGQSGLPAGQWDVARSDFYITLSIRFVNDGVADISITELLLTIRHADVIALSSEKIVLPQPHCIKRRTPHHRVPTGITSTATENKEDVSLPLPHASA